MKEQFSILKGKAHGGRIRISIDAVYCQYSRGAGLQDADRFRFEEELLLSSHFPEHDLTSVQSLSKGVLNSIKNEE